VSRYLRKILKRLLFLAVVGYVSVPMMLVLLATGIYDVVRQGRDLGATFHQYFLVNGTLTWLFSPLNTLIDILSLPFINRKIYQLRDLPEACQKEIREVTEQCPASALIREADRVQADHERTMLMYRWYGFNVPDRPNEVFQRDYRYIMTVGVSTFDRQTRTSRHFGWLRAGVRVLYNIDPMIDEGACIIANGTRHTWSKDGPLFIFDDTLLHQSFNLTDRPRHCLFIDVLRPSYVPILLRGFMRLLGFVSMSVPLVRRTSNWRIV